MKRKIEHEVSASDRKTLLAEIEELREKIDRIEASLLDMIPNVPDKYACTEDEEANVYVQIPASLKTEIKIYRAQFQTTIKEIFIKAVEEYMQNHPVNCSNSSN